MNTNRLLIGLVIALVVAFLLSSFVYKQFQKASIVKPTSSQSLVVAAVPLPLGTRLDASNTRLIQWPANQQVVECSRGWRMSRAARLLHRWHKTNRCLRASLRQRSQEQDIGDDTGGYARTVGRGE